MDGLCFLLFVLLGVVSCSHGWIPKSVLELSVRPGDNITLYCDCKYSSGVFIVWYRNCSHENQPSLILKAKYEPEATPIFDKDFTNPLPRFHFVKNESSQSYDLLILNITKSDEGLYNCGTEETKLEDHNEISYKNVHAYGNVTRIAFSSRVQASDHPGNSEKCGVRWTLLIVLCPASAALSSLLTFLITYRLCQKKAQQVDEKTPDSSSRRREQGEDVCYAALELPNLSQRSTMMKSESFDFSTYSAVSTSRM